VIELRSFHAPFGGPAQLGFSVLLALLSHDDIVRYFFTLLLTEVRFHGFLRTGKYMAGDGDMFAQRKAWGYNRLCAAAAGGAPIERLAKIEVQAVRNMLGNGYAVPSLKESVQEVYRVLESLQTALPMESRSQTRARLFEAVRVTERKWVEARSAPDVAKTVISVALRMIDTGRPLPIEGEFEKECCRALGTFWLDRYVWDSFAPYVMRHGGLSADAYRQMSRQASEGAIPDVSELIHASMFSRGGRLAKRRVARTQPVLHTVEGLNQGI
jgi:hypothetical protein